MARLEPVGAQRMGTAKLLVAWPFSRSLSCTPLRLGLAEGKL